jgi:hypothetical protein
MTDDDQKPSADHNTIYSWANEAYLVLKKKRPHREPHLAEIAKQIMEYHRPTSAVGTQMRDPASIQRELEGRKGFKGLPDVEPWTKP